MTQNIRGNQKYCERAKVVVFHNLGKIIFWYCDQNNACTGTISHVSKKVMKKQKKQKKPKKQPLRLSEQAKIELFGILQPSPSLETTNVKKDTTLVLPNIRKVEFDRELLPFSPPNRTSCPVVQDGYFKQVQ
ncbi:hypothetical protein M0812_23176 [Anaeramoeba flamelloides]|uniref:FLYWCH-type domain-containing protein n=1 Tax=Anaeramoeba flamelloides TaxID=1746091 RepID=A0AAV7YN39_9EUKA|nr:hypothetical protein M0812_23176 [Anaeramoeba flamelloides]